jgi:ABC-2 type transport system permease protein
VSQLLALVWLKWTLFRNSLRSRKAKVGRAATGIATVAGLVLSLGVAVGMGMLTFVVLTEDGNGQGVKPEDTPAFILLFFLVMIFLLWAFVPLGLGGGNRFDAGRMLLYPVSLSKLFLVDLLSEFASLATIFAVPAVFGIAIGAGLAKSNLTSALLIAALGCASGMALAKFLSAAVGSLMRRQRTRGETVLALLGGIVGLAGAAMGQLAPYLARHAETLPGLRWTPPGAVAVGLLDGLEPGREQVVIVSLLILLGYTLILVWTTYRIARRSALGVSPHGRKSRLRNARPLESPSDRPVAWQLPFVSSQLSAIVEKEFRYAMRNAQLKVIAVMAVGLTIVLRLAPFGSRSRGGLGSFTPYGEGAGVVFGVLYVFMLMSPISTNLFGYEGSGLRTLVLAPIERRTILLGKNLAVTLITAVLVAASIIGGGLVFRDLSRSTLLFAALTFLIYASFFALIGNWLSLNFPKRVEFGKRMNRSGVAGLLLIPIFIVLAVPPMAAVGAAHLTESHAVKYVILAAFAAVSIVFYVALVSSQGRSLQRRELEIMEAVTGRAGESGDQILG